MIDGDSVIFEDAIQSIITHFSVQENECLISIQSICSDLDNEEANRNREFDEIDGCLPIIFNEIEVLSKEIEEKIKNKKERFNIFDCLTKHHLEQLHTNFICYLLNVKKEHDCGDLFLNAFIDCIKEDDLEIRECIKSVNLKTSKTQTFSPFFIGQANENSEFSGSIDIFLKIPTTDPLVPFLNIVIENKIWAIEQSTQIKRYTSYCEDLQRKNNEKYLVLYLTLDGKESQESGGMTYHCISYKSTIIKWISNILKQVDNYPLVHSGILFYKKMIENKVLHIPSNPVTMELKKILTKDENQLMLKYWKEVQAAVVEIRNDTRTLFFEKVISKLGHKYKVVAVQVAWKQISSADIWKGSSRGFNIIDDQYSYRINDIDRVVVCVEHNWDSLYCGLNCVKFKDDSAFGVEEISTIAISKQISEIMQRKFDQTCSVGGNYWILQNHYFPLDKGLKFVDDSLNYYFVSQMDEIVNEFVAHLETYLTAWNETIEEISKPQK